MKTQGILVFGDLYSLRVIGIFSASIEPLKLLKSRVLQKPIFFVIKILVSGSIWSSLVTNLVLFCSIPRKLYRTCFT